MGLGLGLGLGLRIVLGLGFRTGLALGLRVGWVLCITARIYSNSSFALAEDLETRPDTRLHSLFYIRTSKFFLRLGCP